MRVRFYFDEDSMGNALVESLRARNVDVLTAIDAGMIERTDEEHLEHAAAHGRVLYSFNVGDFYRLHSNYVSGGKTHAGIILARQQRHPVGEQMRGLLKLVAAKSAAEMQNRVEFLGSWV